MANVEKMSISLPHEIVEDIKEAIDRGEYATASEVVRDALRDWRQKQITERYNALAVPKTVKELRRMIQEGIDSADQGKVKPAEEVFARLKAKYEAMAKAQEKSRKPKR